MSVAEPVVPELEGVVSDVMAKQFLALSSKASAAEASELLAEKNARHVIVIDKDRHVLGVVSERDLLTHFVQSAGDKEPAEATEAESAPWELGNLIRQEPITLLPSIALVAAARVLTTYKIGCLPVVDERKHLIGSVCIHDMLRFISAKLGSKAEEAFCFFRSETEARPKTPAFFRRANGALVLPISCLEDPSEVPEFAVLGYESKTGRILVKLVAEKEDGFRRIIKDGETLVIPASDFVSHFEIKFHGTAFEVARNKHTGVLILTPKQAVKAAPAAPVPAVEPKR